MFATGIVFAALFTDALWGKKQLCKKQQVIDVSTEKPDVEENKSPTKDAFEIQDF